MTTRENSLSVLPVPSGIGRFLTILALLFIGLQFGYTILVNVRSNHAWQRHGADTTLAQQCVKDRGTTMVVSEHWRLGGNLHLLCLDAAGTIFDIIITKITRIDGTTFSEADFVTAYNPGGNSAWTLGKYVQHLLDSRMAKVINLAFEAGEIIFVATH